MKFIFFTLLTFISLFSISQEVDVKKYDLTIRISDTTNRIYVTEIIDFVRITKMPTFSLDLSNIDTSGLGMVVESVQFLNSDNTKLINFKHEKDRLQIDVNNSANAPRELQVRIEYSGIPKDGLIIGENKYGNRTFFGDNWPDRAHNWFACNDRPSDKALVDFNIIAPEHYEVISNGALKGTVNFKSGLRLHAYSSEYELPTKVMVFGAADFSIEELVEFKRFPLSSWVYPENEQAGFSDMKTAIKVLDFFEHKISDYPYEKLANVQSTTRYGGMENAGCIFYSERAITGENRMEELIAHEIAHQWFGNSATEADWQHLWLSEGFATYFTNLYVQYNYGEERFTEMLQKDRKSVLQFYSKYKLPLIDTLSTDLLFMLNTNAYQRGAWVLHMLRNEIGNENFWITIQTYYDKYKYSNATSANFMDIAQEVSGKDLTSFNRQWLQTGVIPELDLNWSQKGKKIKIEIKQMQKGAMFYFPLEFIVYFKDGTNEVRIVDIDSVETIIEEKDNRKIKCIQLDPNVKLLFEKR